MKMIIVIMFLISSCSEQIPPKDMGISKDDCSGAKMYFKECLGHVPYFICTKKNNQIVLNMECDALSDLWMN